MILCSQAKLENDQKGINVKQGIRAKCEMGWRPGPPPIGYFNRSFAGVKDIVVDPDKTLFDIRGYAKHILHHGTTPEKREIIKALGGVVYIHNQFVCSAPSK